MPEMNPYAPPRAEADGEAAAPDAGRPAYKLYSPAQAVLAAFLGTPLAGMYLLSANRRRMGHARLATTTLLVGVVATAVLVAIAAAAPDQPGRGLPLLTTLAMWYYAKQDQPLFDAHVSGGGRKESGWKAAGIGLATGIALLALMVLLLLLTEKS
jgi:hypothetical protein